ncbi:DUF3800 domain-containing protein [Jeotgalibacillus salarius]|nr:DUF3800 domain-containing protein [Jeotgalibacillus salarius]
MTNDNQDLEILEQIDAEILSDEGDDTIPSPEDIAKEIDRKKKKEALWRAVRAGDTKHLTTRVAHILNRYPESRNSDITLQIKYWQVYNGLKSNFVDLTRLYKMERLTSIARSRAKIQNEYKMFLADKKVRARRRGLEESEKESQLMEQPSHGITVIYADETGKTSNYLMVAGVWILNNKSSSKVLRNNIEWKKKKESEGVVLPNEFHFKELKNNDKDLNLYIEFFDTLINNADMASFKAVAVNKTKINKIPISELVNKLYYQFVRLGLNHEIESNRITFPQKIDLIKDEDGDSELTLETLKQSLTDNFKLHFNDDVKIDQIIPMSSDGDIFLQFADLFAGALNRFYNTPGTNHKDKLAEYIINSVGLKEIKFAASDVDTEEDLEAEIDHSVLFLFD